MPDEGPSGFEDLGPYEDLPDWGKIKRGAYRTWWKRRRELTTNKWPVMVRGASRTERVTHSERFRQMFGETLEEYHSRLKAYTLDRPEGGTDGGRDQQQETTDTSGSDRRSPEPPPDRQGLLDLEGR